MTTRTPGKMERGTAEAWSGAAEEEPPQWPPARPPMMATAGAAEAERGPIIGPQGRYHHRDDNELGATDGGDSRRPVVAPPLGASWRRVLAAFGHTGVIRGADSDVMRIYCESVARYERASRLLDASGPLITGARGGELVKNPLHQIVRDDAALVRSLAGDLGLTPAARVGLHDANGRATPTSTTLQRLQATRRTG